MDGYGLIATYTTDASTSSSARIHNIRLALRPSTDLPGTGRGLSLQRRGGRAHRGRRVPPRARVFADGDGHGIRRRHLSGVLHALRGGGKGRAEIVERHSHSLKVTYIPKGMDATVDWGNKDFKFANNTSEPIYIVGYVDGFEQVHINLYGRL